METLIAFVGIFGLIALIVGLIMFLPVFGSRRRLARGLTFGGLAAFIVAIVASPTPPKTETSPVAAASPSPAAKATSPAAEAVSKVGDKEGQAAFLALYRQLLETAKPCDKSVAALGKAAGTGNSYSTYQVAKDGAEACRSAYTAINRMETIEGLPSDGTEKLENALQTCGNAYLYRLMGMEKAMEVADGDDKPSVVSDMSEKLRLAQSGIMLCVAGFYETSAAIGVDSKQMQ
jgi:hypothetical protein